MYVNPFWFGFMMGMLFTIALILMLGSRRKQ